ncbi:MAG: protein kinase [Calditrichaceae bacterium]
MDSSEQNNPKKENFLAPDLVIDDRFKIIEPIRKTIGCVVYHAWDIQQETDKSLLILPQILQADVDAMEIIKENAGALKWLNHPVIAGLYGIHTKGPYNYLEMEFIAGKSIRRQKYENKSAEFSEDIVQQLAIPVLEGLEYAHNQNLLHRNIKPQKILLTGNNQPKLIDFGISDALRSAMALVRDTSSRSAILFMPPEQIRGKQLSVQSDIYALGATLYYILDGKPPFYHGDIHYQILNELPDPIRGVSEEMNNILLKCMAKDISERYQTCGEMIRDIQKLKSGIEPATVEEKEPEFEEYFNNINSSDDVENEPEWISGTNNETHKNFFADNKIINLLVEKIKSSKPVLIWVGAFFIILFLVIGYKVIFSSNANSSTGYSGKVSRDSGTNERMIEALNNAADKQYAAGRYIIPKGNNALELYLEVLKIDSKDEHALNRIKAMKDKLYTEAKNYLDNWMLVEAEELIDNSLDSFEDDQRFKDLSAELNELFDHAEKLPIRIEILNGDGRAAIANTLSKFLKNNGFKVVNTDNYRVNGMVNWQVANTEFLGSLPDNERIGNLESMLNLNYEQKKLGRKQFKSANLLIILGHDYDKIPALRQR